ncbi:hypothetical protein AB0L06_20890 [Spirillospora sp. NPDC052269]
MNYREQWGYALNKPAPSRSVQLSLGFMPTLSVTDMDQVVPPGKDSSGNLYPVTGNVRTDIAPDPTLPSVADDMTFISSLVGVRVHDVALNGTPLSVGENCRAKPTPLNLSSFTGNDQSGRTVLTLGSTFTGRVDIPAFTGCGTSEDLSPLFTASVSGPGNYVQLESAPWCRVVTDPSVCASSEEPTTVSVAPGGQVSLTSKALQMMDSTGTEGVTCDAVTIHMPLRAGHWKQRFLFGKTGTVEYKGCQLTAAGTTIPVRVTDSGSGKLGMSAVDTNEDGTVNMVISGLVPKVSTTLGGKPCTIQYVSSAGGSALGVQGVYDNASHTLTQTSVWQYLPQFGSSTDCQAAANTTPGSTGSFTINPFVFTPPQKITMP